MKRFCHGIIILLVLNLIASCVTTTDSDIDFGLGENDDSNFKIELKLPVDSGACFNPDSGNNMINCITEGDVVKVYIYSKVDISDSYFFDTVIMKKVEDNSAENGSFEVNPRLIKDRYYRFFAEVFNNNGILKTTGGIDGFLYTEDADVNIFMAPAGDFARVVSNRMRSEEASLRTYFDSSGSFGASAVALKDGTVFLSGGYSFDFEQFMPSAMIIDMKTLTTKNVAILDPGLVDHASALLDDGSETGKVIIAFGKKNRNENSKDIIMYDPEADIYSVLKSDSPLTGAKAISIDGNVYIVGGCSKETASTKIYKVDKKSASVSEYAQLKEGRCNFGIADISTVKDGIINPAIFVVGGSSDEIGEEPVLENFAEVIIGGKSTVIELRDRDGEDSAGLYTNGLISPAATTVLVESFDTPETVVAVTGGYLKTTDTNSKLYASSIFYALSKVDNKWVYDKSYMPYHCTRPSVGNIGSIENSSIGRFAVNCGTGDLDKDSKASDNQIIFTAKVKKVSGQDYDYYEIAVQSTLNDEHRDPENGVLVYGPVAVDNLGQAFMFGTKYVYKVGTYSIPK